MQERIKRKKRAVNLSIDADLAAEAKEVGTNLSALLERALEQELRQHRAEKWRAENRQATESMNGYVKKHGLWSDKYRTW